MQFCQSRPVRIVRAVVKSNWLFMLQCPQTAADIHACAAAGPAGAAEPLPSHVLQQEYELVRNAFYTEPHDQSSWLYLRWLIGNSIASWEKAKGSPQEAAATQVSARAMCCVLTTTCLNTTLLSAPCHFTPHKELHRLCSPMHFPRFTLQVT